VSKRRELWITLGTIAAVLGLWYLGAWLLEASGDPIATRKLPYPHLVLDQMVEERAALAEAAWTNLRQALLGFAFGALVAVLLSVFMAQAAWLESALMPFVLAAQMIPMIALVPISQTVFQSDDLTRLFISAFITYLVVTLATVRGLKAAPPQAYELLSSYNAGRAKTVRFLQFPAAVPLLFTGLRIAAPLSLVGSILVDLTGAQSGLGFMLVAALTFGSQGGTLLWAATIILLVLGLLMSQAVSLAERLLAPWQPSLRTEGR
jgi:NitT/TauT family transport system permease protein